MRNLKKNKIKTRYFTSTDKKNLSGKYQIPATTLQGWEKKRTSDDWRGFLFDRLSLFLELEDSALTKIKQIFKKEELQAIWGSLKSTMVTKDLIFMKEALGYGFIDYCNYESMEASQFADDLEKFAKVVSEKLNNLSEFEKFTLLEYIASKESQKDLFFNLHKYDFSGGIATVEKATKRLVEFGKAVSLNISQKKD